MCEGGGVFNKCMLMFEAAVMRGCWALLLFTRLFGRNGGSQAANGITAGDE